MLKVTSAANPTVKMMKALHAKKGRQETGLFLAEGARLAREAADLGIWPDVIAAAESALERAHVGALLESAEQAGARVMLTTEGILGQIAKRENPQTVIGAYRQRWSDLDALADGDLAVALHEARDPGNLGTILRACDSVGAAGVVLIGQSCDPFSVEAVRATMGSIFSIPIARASLEEVAAWRLRRQFTMIGASLDGAMRHDEPDIGGKVLLLMGTEQSGLPPEAEAACDTLVRIPMKGRADSLNLAMATTVMLYDIWRRRGYAGARP